MQLSSENQKKLEIFRWLKKNDKYDVVLQFMEAMKDSDELAYKIYNLLVELWAEKVEEKILVDIYTLCLYTLEDLSKEERWEYMSRMEELRQKLEDIRRREAEAKKKEEKYLQQLLAKLEKIPDAT